MFASVLSRSQHLSDALRSTPALVVAGFFTVFGGFDLLAQQFAPGWDRPPMIAVLTDLGPWQWSTMALAAAVVLIFEGTYRQARRLRTERDAAVKARDDAANARAQQRRAIMDSAEAETRLKLAAALTRVHRHVAGWERLADFPRESLAEAGRLKDHLAHYPEALAFWAEFSSALSDVDVQDHWRGRRPATPEDVEAMFANGDPGRDRLADIVRRFTAWLRQGD